MLKKKKIDIVLIIASLLVFSSCMVFYAISINDIKDAQTKSENLLKVDEFNKIYLYMTMLKNSAQERVDRVATDIESDFKSQFNNEQIEIIKGEFDNNNFKSIYDILIKHTKDKFIGGVKNGNNDMFVATKDFIVTDFSYNNNSQYSTDIKINKPKNWDEFISEPTMNVELANKAKLDLLNKSRDFIIVERINQDDNTHKHISSANYQSLLDVYLEEGIEGLKGYTVYVQSYITNTGDVFNTKDFYLGHRISNHKFIIVQEFNVYDQIMKNHPELFDNSQIEQRIKDNALIMITLYTIGALFTLVYAGTIILSLRIFNHYLSCAGLCCDDGK